ncbi:MAG: hypothetical protein AB1486_03625 [Planctomycetota bacterium]
MARRTKRTTLRRKVASEDLYELLHQNLSEQELRTVLVSALLALKPNELDHLAQRLGPETGGTLRRLMRRVEKRVAGARPAASPSKVQETWEKAWSSWWERVAEAADEDGKYTVQEHHWEPPYLDSNALTSDLEPIASQIRELIPRVMDSDLDRGFSMADAFVEAVDEIASGLPEWMEGSLDNGIPFGPQATRCLLEWEWRATRRDRRGAYDWAERIRGFQLSNSRLDLDANTLIEFIHALGEAQQKEILDGIEQHRDAKEWVEVLSSPYSEWFMIYQDLCQRWNVKGYLEHCRKNLGKDWKLSLPVIEELLRKKQPADAFAIAEEAVRSLLHLREGDVYDPRRSLLSYRTRHSVRGAQDTATVRLLRLWLKASEALDRPEWVWALKIQLVVITEANDWDAILGEFERIPSPQFDTLRNRLFSEWRSFIVASTLGEPLDADDDSEVPRETWVHGLVNAVAKGGDRAASFRQSVSRWLAEVERTPETLKGARHSLARLTLNLEGKAAFRLKYRALYEVLARSSDDRAVHKSLRNWLERCKAGALVPGVMAFWKRNVARLVPDPRSSDYESCAAWLAAVKELDPTSFGRIINDWSVTHRRRKNLWSALSKRNLYAKAGE